MKALRGKTLSTMAFVVAFLVLTTVGAVNVCNAQLIIEDNTEETGQTDVDIDGNIILSGSICVKMKNTSGGDLSTGEVVVPDSSSYENRPVTTTTTDGDPTVLGVVVRGGGNGEWITVAVGGMFEVNVLYAGSASIGSFLMASTTAGVAKHTPTAEKGVFAVVVYGSPTPGNLLAMPIMVEVF